MKMLGACLAASVVVALCMALYSLSESGISIVVLGVASVAFLYALTVAAVFGVPLHFVARKIQHQRPFYFAIAGGLFGVSFFLAAPVMSGRYDASILKLALVAGVAGLLAGWLFQRIALCERT